MAKTATESTTHYHPQGSGQAQLMITSKGSFRPKSSLSRLVLNPGSAVPRHFHHQSEEYVYILSGHGVLSIDNSQIEFGPGTALFIPKGQFHEVKNLGETAIEAIQVYTPAGPELRFKQWPTGPIQ